ncbi:Plant peroxidase [Macleaya cordata]|uniref:Peroxidase n=1 Tax=Macleaya cordata TaxID=56857 RepID=A0A200PY72_MACCD|nr:Plant peroxidase [Macleaya cordata]
MINMKSSLSSHPSFLFLILVLIISSVVLLAAADDYQPANYDNQQVPGRHDDAEKSFDEPAPGEPDGGNDDEGLHNEGSSFGPDHRTWTSILPEPTISGLLPLDSYLSFDYYRESCPELEEIIQRKVAASIKDDHTIAASLIRLHFHDCAVRGCDGSILLNHEGSERSAKGSRTLRGFELIDDIKAEVEKKCPKTVSCADILTATARDATLEIGGPFWEVPYGRKDGRVSSAKEADEVPMGRESITTLIEFFQSRGLNLVDLVILSGAHTIGRSECGVIQYRLYNFNGTGKADPSIDEKYLNFLKRKCRWASEYVDLDGETPETFDSMYYTNLQKKMGLLSTDQLLYSDSRTAGIVDTMTSQPWLFLQQFSVSMMKLGNTQVLTGKHEGEIRTNCNSVNNY